MDLQDGSILRPVASPASCPQHGFRPIPSSREHAGFQTRALLFWQQTQAEPFPGVLNYCL